MHIHSYEFMVILSFPRAYFQYFRQLHDPYFSKRSIVDDYSDTESDWTVCTVSFVNERKQIMWRHAQNVVSLIGLGCSNFNSTLKLVTCLRFVFIEILDKFITVHSVFVKDFVWDLSCNCISTRHSYWYWLTQQERSDPKSSTNTLWR